jgi:hypothetical protein
MEGGCMKAFQVLMIFLFISSACSRTIPVTSSIEPHEVVKEHNTIGLDSAAVAKRGIPGQ